MAYKVSHRLRPVHYPNFIKKIEPDLKEKLEQYIEDNEDISWVISEGLNEWGDSDRSFSDSDENMKEMSLHFPNLLFILDYDPIYAHRLGDYREYWYRGKVQRENAEISIGAFDSDELKEVK